jgi:hypothetical protein
VGEGGDVVRGPPTTAESGGLPDQYPYHGFHLMERGA